jgi:predicted DsbA family dithiol-disulfide isomerase
MTIRVEVWSDVVCPWCYLGKRRLERAVQESGADATVVHRSYQLDPGATTVRPTATMLAEKYRLGADQVDTMQREMEARAAADGLEYHLDGQLSGNTFDAHRLLHLAADRDRQDAMAERLFRAHFTEQRSVFDAASLTDLAGEVGLDTAEVAAALAGDDYTEAVQADIAQARAYGVTGVPFFVFDARIGVSGAQPVELLRTALEQAAAPV